MSVESFLAEKAAKTEHALDTYLKEWPAAPARLDEAIRYSLFAGGKRLRPTLTLAAAELVGGDDAPALYAACAIEMIHTYSLVHDDLPAMDDDDLRRGRPTLHKAHGEALAILAGDAMLTMAFDLLSRTGNVQVIGEVARAAGLTGMAGGQVADLEAEGTALSIDEVQAIHERKTGALMSVSVRAGALLAGGSREDADRLGEYGRHLGLAFQITDDILDVTGDTDTLGKPSGSDAASEKSTYPGILGIDESRARAKEAAGAAVQALEPYGAKAENLVALAGYAVERDH